VTDLYRISPRANARLAVEFDPQSGSYPDEPTGEACAVCREVLTAFELAVAQEAGGAPRCAACIRLDRRPGPAQGAGDASRAVTAAVAKSLPSPPPAVAAALDLDDEELVRRMFAARNGAAIERLWRGDWSGYASQSEADLALCSHLAFWAGGDPARIDRLFRRSGLYRAKWEREDYRSRTIEAAITGAAETYRPGSGSLRPEAAEASGETAPAATSTTVVVTAAEFAEGEEETPDAALATDGEGGTPLPADGTGLLWGAAGSGKTTLELDLGCHLAAGRSWLGLLHPDRPLHVLIVEAEGPRAMFRAKVRAKLDHGWREAVGDRLHIWEAPWATVNLGDEGTREALAEAIGEREIDLAMLGPIAELGFVGGGTPEEVTLWTGYLSDVRRRAGRPVSFLLVHHPNRSGEKPAGAWERVPDLDLHIEALGHGHAKLTFEKARWSPRLHKKSFLLNWAEEGESYEVVEKPVLDDATIAEAILSYVRDNPGCSWNAVEDGGAPGRRDRKRAIRDRLLEEGRLENRGGKGGFVLYVTDEVRPEWAHPRGAHE
jgi:hypothetical protein